MSLRQRKTPCPPEEYARWLDLIRKDQDYLKRTNEKITEVVNRRDETIYKARRRGVRVVDMAEVLDMHPDNVSGRIAAYKRKTRQASSRARFEQEKEEVPVEKEAMTKVEKARMMREGESE